MCGIAGIIAAEGGAVDRRVLAAMAERMKHRGPDDEGIHVEGPVGLAHRRLSVLDLSPAGRQPMTNEDGSIWIVFNGEIYNFQELRQRLEARHVFRSRTDTEVLLHLYEEDGPGCVEMLRGMFAFAIWDRNAGRVMLARDRFGKKPLFYIADERGLRFASELKALLVTDQGAALNPVALHHYLTFQYVPAPWTIFEGIQKLRPGHVLTYEHGRVTDNAYWSLRYQPKRVDRGDHEDQQEFMRLLEESVKLRLISDVPVGAFLSGGMDSSAVVALMSRLMTQPVQTFSIGFKDEAYNELPYAREVARRFGTDHHELVVEPSAVEILPTLVRVYDEPYADPSAIPTYCVSRLAREFVTVVLNGDGGDEMLAGYPRYHLRRLERVLAVLLPLAGRRASLRDRVGRFLAACPRRTPGVRTLARYLERLLEPLHETYLRRICYFTPAAKQELYTAEFASRVSGHDSAQVLLQWFEAVQASDPLDQLLGVDTRSYLPDDLLVKVDRATMAFGLEARSPFLDHTLVEFGASLPVSRKLIGRDGKRLLKAAMADLLPRSILERPKQGFGVPLDRWFREDCAEFLREILLSRRAATRGYFKPESVRRLIDQHQTGSADYSARLYALLMLELWHREYVDGAAAPCEAGSRAGGWSCEVVRSG